MQYIHYHNDFTVPISLVSDSITISPEMINSVTFYTRKQGNSYCCCWDCKTLYKDDSYIYAVLNNHNLEPGVLKYVVEYQIPDSNYPDGFQKICQHYTSEIELTTQNGDITVADALIIYSDTIRELLESAGYSYTKEEVDEMIAQLDLDINTYSKAEIDAKIGNAYTKSETDTLLSGKADSNSVYTKTESDNKYLTDQDISLLASKSEIPTKTSLLINDSNFASDASYVHTDNNYSTAEKNKLAGLSNYDDTALSNRVSANEDAIDEIINTNIDGLTDAIQDITLSTYRKSQTYSRDEIDDLIAQSGGGSVPDNVVIDANYVHTDNNFTTTEKNKLSGIEAGAEVNVQSDWNVTDSSSDAYIKNKPTIPTVPTNVSSFTNDSGYLTSQKITLTLYNRSGVYSFSKGSTALTSDEAIQIITDTSKDVEIVYNNNTYHLVHLSGGGDQFTIKYNHVSDNDVFTIQMDYWRTDGSYDFDWTISMTSAILPVLSLMPLGFGYFEQKSISGTTITASATSNYTFILHLGAIVAVHFTQDVPAKATLNINSTGAKQMLYGGSSITSGKITAGLVGTFMYFANVYQLLNVI